jgi:hypothetical protein
MEMNMEISLKVLNRPGMSPSSPIGVVVTSVLFVALFPVAEAWSQSVHINKWIGKENAVNALNGVLLSYEKNKALSSVTAQVNLWNVKWNMPCMKSQILHDLIISGMMMMKRLISWQEKVDWWLPEPWVAWRSRRWANDGQRYLIMRR